MQRFRSGGNKKQTDDAAVKDEPKKPEAPAASSPPSPVKKPESAKQVIEYKFDIAKRLEKAEKTFRYRKNRSPDLVPLKRDYDAMRKRLPPLIKAAKKYMDVTKDLEGHRTVLVQELSKCSVDSPMYERVGKDQRADGDTLVDLNKQLSYVDKKFAERYQDQVVDYCVEWEQVVTKRVDQAIKDHTEKQKEYNHYQAKVDTLRKKSNERETKGRGEDPKLTEKLQRNEQKLEETWKLHERSASHLCDLLEEVTVRGWKDLYPLLLAILKCENDHSSQSRVIYSKFVELSEKLEDDYLKNNIVRQPSQSDDDDDFVYTPGNGAVTAVGTTDDSDDDN